MTSNEIKADNLNSMDAEMNARALRDRASCESPGLKMCFFLCPSGSLQLAERPTFETHTPEHAILLLYQCIGRVELHNSSAVQNQQTVVIDDCFQAMGDFDPSACGQK
jgi:hypothetical protein